MIWAVLVVVLLLVGAVVYFLKGNSQKGLNPFPTDVGSQEVPLIHDQKVRNNVLKNIFTEEKVPSDLDAIVVGSGIGGLTVAVCLAKVGKKVLVLEQHDQIGGCCHTFFEKGMEFDTGIHYIGEMSRRSMNRTVVDQLTDGKLQWDQMAEDYDTVVFFDDSGKVEMKFPIVANRQKFRDNLVNAFPEDEQAIDSFMKLLQSARGTTAGYAAMKILPRWMATIIAIVPYFRNKLTRYFKLSGETAETVLKRYFPKNDKLRSILAYNWGDYGTPPNKAPFIMQAGLLNHFMYGAFYPRGGSAEIAFNMAPIITRAGGACLVKVRVNKMLMEGKRVVGVKTEKGVEIKAPMVISDAGVWNTFLRLLPQEGANAAPQAPIKNAKSYLQHAKKGIAAAQVFIGLDGSAEDLGLQNENKQYWMFTSRDHTKLVDDLWKGTPDDLVEKGVPLLFLTFPSVKDTTWSSRYPDKTTAELVTLMPFEWFERWQDQRVNKRDGEYKQMKHELGQRMWQQVLTLFPQLEGKDIYFEVGTPVTNKHYLSSPFGEIYGLDHNYERFSARAAVDLRPETGIPGLYLTGQDVLTAGFTGALFGGLLCSSAILNRNLLQDLTPFVKQRIVEETAKKKSQ